MPRRLQTALYNADQLVKKKSYKKALAEIESYLKKNPKAAHVRLFLHLGLIHYNLYDYRSAEDYFLKATGACPCLGPAWVNLSATRQNRENFVGAARALEKGAEAMPDNQGLRLKAAILWNKAGTPERALEILTASGKTPPDSAWLTALAMTYKKLGNNEKAAQALEKAAGMGGKKSVKMKLQAATLYMELGQYKKARRLFEEMARRPSCGRACLNGLIRCCIKEKRFDQADKAIKMFLEKSPEEPELWRLSAWIKTRKNEPDKAAAALEVAYKLAGPSPKDFEQLGYLYQKADAPEKAAEAYAKSYSTPLKPENLDMLAGLYTEAHRTEKALEFALKAVRSAPTSVRWARAGDLYYRARQYERSMEAYKTAAGLNDDQGEMSYKAGLAALKMDRFESARELFETAVSRAGSDSESRKRAIRALEAVNEMIKREAAVQGGEAGQSSSIP